MRPAVWCGSLFLIFAAGFATAQNPATLKIYRGNTHSHSALTWSHGEQWIQGTCRGVMTYSPLEDQPEVSGWTLAGKMGEGNCAAILVVKGLQFPSYGMKLREDWKQVQGLPARHFELARKAGMDFYVMSDHSQEDPFFPSSANNEAWQLVKKQAAANTDKDFAAIAGFEFSENDGPGGVGHVNVMNSEGMLNALQPGVNLPVFYKWLVDQKPNESGPIVASFNHPGPRQYNDWDYRTPAVTDVITMLEVINSNVGIHYDGFVSALDHGWKVSPVSGRDNHGLTGITTTGSRTFVLAPNGSKRAILEAMKQRRTYASLDTNIQCRYTVNGSIMGSTLAPAESYVFDIQVSDPDTGTPAEMITKMDIVRDGGEVVESFTPPAPGFEMHWKVTVRDTKSHYFFVRVWNASGGNVPKADPTKPVAWLAPVWTGRAGVVQGVRPSAGPKQAESAQ